jgi:two-component system CheB/CheR fusion protein
MLRNSTGVDFTQYKVATIKRRLQRRMVLNKIVGIDNYIKCLQENHEEVQLLYQDILIHVTQFFRDQDSFTAMATEIFPVLMH